MHISNEQWAQIQASEGVMGYTDVLTQTPLAEIQHPVVLRGDGLTGAIFDLDALLAYFAHQQKLGRRVRHPILQDRTITLDDVEAVTGERVCADNTAYVNAVLANKLRPEYAEVLVSFIQHVRAYALVNMQKLEADLLRNLVFYIVDHHYDDDVVENVPGAIYNIAVEILQYITNVCMQEEVDPEFPFRLVLPTSTHPKPVWILNPRRASSS